MAQEKEYLKGGETVLLKATEQGNQLVANRLIRAGANPNGRDEEQNTPLIHTAIKGLSSTAYLLLQQGADIAAANSFNNTAMHRAACYLQGDLCETLIWAGSYNHLDKKDYTGKKPVDFLKCKPADHPQVEDVRKLITRLEWFEANTPQVEDWSAVNRDDLLAPTNGNPYALLDYPETWQHLHEILPALEAQGTPLEKADLMAVSTVHGVPHLLNGCRAMQWAELAGHIMRSGGAFEPQDFMRGGKPTELLDFFIRHEAVLEVFTPEIWQNRSANSLRTTLNQLPEDIRETIPNRHALLASATQHGNQREHGI